jgi:hypothetical protein
VNGSYESEPVASLRQATGRQEVRAVEISTWAGIPSGEQRRTATYLR